MDVELIKFLNFRIEALEKEVETLKQELILKQKQ